MAFIGLRQLLGYGAIAAFAARREENNHSNCILGRWEDRDCMKPKTSKFLAWLFLMIQSENATPFQQSILEMLEIPLIL